MKKLLILFTFVFSLSAGAQVIVNSDGSHSVVHGDVIVNSDGSHSVKHGNVIVNSNGSHSVVHGNVLVNPDGSHSVKHGNVIVNPDGSHTVVSGDNLSSSEKRKSDDVLFYSKSISTSNDKSNYTITFQSYPDYLMNEKIILAKPTLLSESQETFWNELLKHCGSAYTGKLEAVPAPADFAGKELKMYVMSCDENTIKIPFYVGEDRSRTWMLTKTVNGILLKHDHRLADGSEDEVTMYGGLTSNGGSANVQFFPADQETTDVIPGAAANLWWITIDDSQFSYNLRRVTGPNLFSVVFDLTNPIETPELPWGHE